MLRLSLLLCFFSFSLHAQVLRNYGKNYQVTVMPSAEGAALFLDTNKTAVVLGGAIEPTKSTLANHSCVSPVVTYICRFADGDSIVSPKLSIRDPFIFLVSLRGHIPAYGRKDKLANGWNANDILREKILSTRLVSLSVCTVSYMIVGGSRTGNPTYDSIYTVFLDEKASAALHRDIRAAMQ